MQETNVESSEKPGGLNQPKINPAANFYKLLTVITVL